MFDINYILGNSSKKATPPPSFRRRQASNVPSRPPTSSRYVPGWVKLPWKQEYVKQGIVPNLPGLYAFFDGYNKMLYVGHASRLRHRLQSYYQKDCFEAHPTKRTLRSKIQFFAFKVENLNKAMALERNVKQGLRYNYK